MENYCILNLIHLMLVVKNSRVDTKLTAYHVKKNPSLVNGIALVKGT